MILYTTPKTNIVPEHRPKPKMKETRFPTVNFQVLLLMEEILYQLRLLVYPIIGRVFHLPGGDRRISEPSTVCQFQGG